MPQPRHKAVIAGLAVTLTLGGVALPAVATTSEAPASDSDPNGMGDPAPADYDKSDYYEGAEGTVTFATARSASRLSPVALCDEMKYFTKYESGCDYDKGLSYGDGYNAMGYYQFDRRYALMPFIQQVYSYNSTKYAMLKAPLAQRDMLANPSYEMYDYTSRQLSAPAQILNEAWHAAYAADPAEFSALQDAYAYSNYYLPAQSMLLNSYGVDVRDRADCVKGLVWGMCNLFGQGGVQKFFDGREHRQQHDRPRAGHRLVRHGDRVRRRLVPQPASVLGAGGTATRRKRPPAWRTWTSMTRSRTRTARGRRTISRMPTSPGRTIPAPASRSRPMRPRLRGAECADGRYPGPECPRNRWGRGGRDARWGCGAGASRRAAEWPRGRTRCRPGPGWRQSSDEDCGTERTQRSVPDGNAGPGSTASPPRTRAIGLQTRVTPDPRMAAPAARGSTQGDSAPEPGSGLARFHEPRRARARRTTSRPMLPRTPIPRRMTPRRRPAPSATPPPTPDCHLVRSGEKTASDATRNAAKKAPSDAESTVTPRAARASSGDLPDTGDIAAMVVTGAAGLAVAGTSFLSLAKKEREAR